MKLLVVSHAALVPANQSAYAALERRGHELVLVTPDGWRHEYAPGVLRPARLPGLRAPMTALRIAGRGSVPLHVYLARCDAVLRRHRPDVLYVEEEPYSLAAWQWTRAARRAGIPYVAYTAQNLAKRYPLPFRLIERAAGNSGAAVAVSQDAADALRARGFAGPVTVVPLPVDLGQFTGVRRDPALAGRLGLRRHVVGYLGRLVPEKGVRVLLDAYRALPSRDSVSLLVVGGGPLAGEVGDVDGAVCVPGVPQADVPSYLALADLLCVPSLTTPGWREQFGRVVTEAAAAGVPVVTSDSGELPRLVTASGAGVVVPEADAAALAVAIEALLADPARRAELAARGRTAADELWSADAVAARLEAAFQAALR